MPARGPLVESDPVASTALAALADRVTVEEAASADHETRLGSVESGGLGAVYVLRSGLPEIQIDAGLADTAAAITAALPVAGAAGADVLLKPGAHAWNTTVGLPAAITKRLRIGSAPGARITLGTPRMFDFAKVADNDTFQNIDLEDHVIDAGNTGGFHHVLWGTYQDGVVQTQINFSNLNARRIRITNVATEDGMATHHRPAVYLVVSNPGGSATLNTIYRVSHEDVVIGDGVTGGGNGGIIIGGAGGAAGAGGITPNVKYDEIDLHRCSHDRGLTPTAGATLNNFQVGSRAYGGTVRISKLFGKGSPDTGLEVNNVTRGSAKDCVFVDCFSSGYLFANFRDPEFIEQQYFHYENCGTRRSSAGTSTAMACKGFRVGTTGSATQRIGTLKYSNCGFYAAQTPTFNDSGYLLSTVTSGTVPTIDHIILEDPKCHIDSAAGTFGSTQTPSLITTMFNGKLDVIRPDFKVAGSVTMTSGTLQPKLIYLLGGTQVVDIDPGDVDYNVTNTGLLYIVQLGSNATTVSGRIRRPNVTQITGAAASRGIRVLGSATLTIPTSITVDGVWSGLSDVAVLFDSDNQDKVQYNQTKGYVNHGATASTLRPPGFASVEWVGSVSPTNAINGDTWVNTA